MKRSRLQRQQSPKKKTRLESIKPLSIASGVVKRLEQAGAGMGKAFEKAAEESKPFIHEMIYLEKEPKPLTPSDFMSVTSRRKMRESWRSIADSYGYRPSTLRRLYFDAKAGMMQPVQPESEVMAEEQAGD